MSRKILALITSLMTLVVLCGAPAVAFASGNGVTKEETVYVVTDSTGSQNDVIVSDHLNNDDQLDKIADKSTLKDIENVKGDEEFTKDGDNLEWDAQGNDIYYQGKTDKTVPISMDVSYKLDGKEISGPDLQGKSGDVEITIKFNNEAEYNGTTVPFIVLTGMLVKDNCFKDVKVNNGKVIDDGDKLIVAGLAAPGLAQTLELGDHQISLGDTVKITGTADDFAVEDLMTIVTNSVFEDIDTGDLGNLDFDDQIKQLDDGAQKLVSGSKELNEGLNKLDGSVPALTSGVSQLSNGANSLYEGAKLLKSGSDALYKGLLAVKVGLGTGNGTAENPGLSNVLASVDNGMGTAAENLGKSKALTDGAKLEVDGVSTNLGTASALLDGAVTALNGAVTSLGNVEITGKDAVTSKITSAKSTLSNINTEGMTEGQKAVIESAIDDLTEAGNNMDDLSVSGVDAAKTAVNGAATPVGQVKQVVDGCKNTLSVKGQGEGNYPTSTKLQLSSQIQGGIYDSLTKADGGGLLTGIKGAEQINNTVLDNLGDEKTEDTLLYGAYSISTGLGNNEQKPGSTDLTSGAEQLANGLSQLDDKSGELADGVGQLDKGSLQLANGMSQLYTEGIKKIVDLYNDDLKGLTQGLGNMMDAGKGYNSFTKKPGSMKGSVKFIYKTTINK